MQQFGSEWAKSSVMQWRRLLHLEAASLRLHVEAASSLGKSVIINERWVIWFGAFIV